MFTSLSYVWLCSACIRSRLNPDILDDQGSGVHAKSPLWGLCGGPESQQAGAGLSSSQSWADSFVNKNQQDT